MTKDRLHEIIFEADTKKGKLFDVILLIAILWKSINNYRMGIYYIIYYRIYT